MSRGGRGFKPRLEHIDFKSKHTCCSSVVEQWIVVGYNFPLVPGSIPGNEIQY